MFDLASDLTIADITSQIFDKGGVVAALCHGPAGKAVPSCIQV